MIDFNDFEKIDIRVGTILNAEKFENVKKPAYKITVDFGSEIGIKKTSAQITECYDVKSLINKQILGIINLPPKQIKDYMSGFLLLGIYSNKGVILISPDQKVDNGDKIG